MCDDITFIVPIQFYREFYARISCEFSNRFLPHPTTRTNGVYNRLSYTRAYRLINAQNDASFTRKRLIIRSDFGRQLFKYVFYFVIRELSLLLPFFTIVTIIIINCL